MVGEAGPSRAGIQAARNVMIVRTIRTVGRSGWNMSSRGDRTWRVARALALGPVLLAGCGQFPRQHLPKHPVGLLDGGGRTAKVTSRQEADVEIALARTMEERGELEQAEATYREALRKDPKRVDALVRLAILHDQRAKFKESADFFTKALAIKPDDPDILCDQGYSFYVQRRWAEAEQNFRKALKKKPDLARAHNNLGLVMACDGREDEAISEFRKAGCDVSDAHANLALVLAEEGRWLEARQHYGSALTAKPMSAVAKEGTKATTTMLAKAPGPKVAPSADPSVARAGATATRPAQ